MVLLGIVVTMQHDDQGAWRAAAHRYKSASTVRSGDRGISRSLRSMTAKGPRNLNCATSGLRDSRNCWSSAGFTAFIRVTSGVGNRRAQPTEYAMRAISGRAAIRKPGRAIAAAVPGMLLPNTIQRRVVNLDASDFGFAFL